MGIVSSIMTLYVLYVQHAHTHMLLYYRYTICTDGILVHCAGLMYCIIIRSPVS